MARQHGPTAQRHVASPMTVDIARLGRRPGAMFELHDTVHSPARIGLELIAIDQGAPFWTWICGSSRCPKACW